MSCSIGLDIGGTKIAGAVFDQSGNLLAQDSVPTPAHYADFLAACGKLVAQFDKVCGHKAAIGIGIAGVVDSEKGTVNSANIPYMKGRAFRNDLETSFGRPVRIANDAVCAVLAEALDGAGKGYRSVFGLILGTGVGGASVIDEKIIENTAGMAGEIGHRPLPFRESSDGPAVACACGQAGCINKSASGPALARLYKEMTGKQADAERIAGLATQGDAEARRVLDRFYTTIAKAMAAVLEDFEPDVIVVSGGLASLPGLYDAVPKRWGRYAVCKALRAKFVPAKHGALSGVRGAARLGKER